MPKIKSLITNEDGWTDWMILPEEYRLGCCDCGLMHDMEFAVMRVAEHVGRDVRLEPYDGEELKIVFRASRNRRSTAQMRRYRKNDIAQVVKLNNTSCGGRNEKTSQHNAG